jgi:hypothetical protein
MRQNEGANVCGECSITVIPAYVPVKYAGMRNDDGNVSLGCIELLN